MARWEGGGVPLPPRCPLLTVRRCRALTALRPRSLLRSYCALTALFTVRSACGRAAAEQAAQAREVELQARIGAMELAEAKRVAEEMAEQDSFEQPPAPSIAVTQVRRPRAVPLQRLCSHTAGPLHPHCSPAAAPPGLNQAASP